MLVYSTVTFLSTSEDVEILKSISGRNKNNIGIALLNPYFFGPGPRAETEGQGPLLHVNFNLPINIELSAHTLGTV